MAGSRRNLTTSYAPRSPDLSALSASQQPSYAHDQHTHSIPPHSQPYDQGSLSHQHRDAFPVPHSAPSSAYLAPPLLDDSFGASMYGSHQQYQQPQHLSPYQQQHNPYSQDPLQDPGGGPRLPRRARQDQGGEAWTLGYQTSQPRYPFDPARPQDSLAYQPGPPREQDQHFPVKVEMVKQEEPLKPAPGELENVTVKTKFPVARIKRIVQADDDVGKVAQVTPVVVSKALELFMISLALKSADNARARQSKRVLGSHLKSVIETEGQFDFLSDIASRIADAPSGPSKEPGKKGVKSEDEDEDDVADEYEAAPKKKGRGTRSRPKKESP